MRRRTMGSNPILSARQKMPLLSKRTGGTFVYMQRESERGDIWDHGI